MKPAALPVLRATRLLDQVRERIRYKHYSLRTENVQWVRMFVKWHGLRHPRDMGRPEIESFPARHLNHWPLCAACIEVGFGSVSVAGTVKAPRL